MMLFANLPVELPSHIGTMARLFSYLRGTAVGFAACKCWDLSYRGVSLFEGLCFPPAFPCFRKFVLCLEGPRGH